MAYDYCELLHRAQQWAQQAEAAHWLSPAATAALATLDNKSPDSLFGNSDARPLIVAFLGGSGVGKSSLLNRLAGKAIARVGVERPTSREITLFHHHSVAIQNLPEHLPITHIKIAQHEEEGKRQIIWMDMPDFDSTEQANKQLVLQWLPHIDVLIYVVSPERYRDEKAWQILLAEGATHAWLFVLNQWDRGQFEQYEDFRQQLHKAGFFEPIIFKTVCVDDWQSDEFNQLEATLRSLAQTHTIRQLQQRGEHLRKQALQQTLSDLRTDLASPNPDWQNPWRHQWQTTASILQQGLQWPLQNAAKHFAEHAADLFAPKHDLRQALWDAWAQARVDDALDSLVLEVSGQGWSALPLKTALTELRGQAGDTVCTQAELAVRQALAKPGHLWQRVLLKIMRLLEITLPLAAMAWVGYQVSLGFYQSSHHGQQYLGVDFAVHSLLLVAITWLLPFFILKKAQPSLEKSALNGLGKGVALALEMLEEEVATVLDNYQQTRAAQLAQLDTLIADCALEESTRLPVPTDANLQRMLLG